jgi:transposase
VKWFNKKYGKEVDNREWVKIHLMCGVNTNIVTSAEMSGWSAADTNFFRPLLDTTAASFEISEVSADKAYLSHANATAIEAVGATPFIPFKSNTVPVNPAENSAWARMYHLFAYDRDTFLKHYHKRSNVETTFSMIKAKLGDAVLSKSDTGQMNEVLAKVLAHNICVVIGAIHELGIEPKFGRAG